MWIAIVIIVLAFIWFVSQKNEPKQSGPNREINERLSRIEENIESLSHKSAGKAQKDEFKPQTKQEVSDLKADIIKQLILNGSSKEETAATANKIIDEINFDLDTEKSYSFRFSSARKWVESQEKDQLYKKRYGHLLEKAKHFVSTKERIERDDLEKELETDYKGASWLIEKLKDDKDIEEVTKWDGESESSVHDYWKVKV